MIVLVDLASLKDRSEFAAQFSLFQRFDIEAKIQVLQSGVRNQRFRFSIIHQ